MDKSAIAIKLIGNLTVSCILKGHHYGPIREQVSRISRQHETHTDFFQINTNQGFRQVVEGIGLR